MPTWASHAGDWGPRGRKLPFTHVLTALCIQKNGPQKMITDHWLTKAKVSSSSLNRKAAGMSCVPRGRGGAWQGKGGLRQSRHWDKTFQTYGLWVLSPLTEKAWQKWLTPGCNGWRRQANPPGLSPGCQDMKVDWLLSEVTLFITCVLGSKALPSPGVIVRQHQSFCQGLMLANRTGTSCCPSPGNDCSSLSFHSCLLGS